MPVRAILLAALILVPSIALAGGNEPADRWERSLLEKKKQGKLPGPKPGQKCLWSEKLKACLWYTPGKGLR